MLSGGGDDEPIENSKLSASISTNDLTAPAPTAMDTTTSTTTAATVTAASASIANPVKKISIKNKLTSVPSKTTFGPTDDEEHKPVREIVKLEYTQEELSAMQSASNNYAVDNDYHTDYDFGSGKKHAAGVGAGTKFGSWCFCTFLYYFLEKEWILGCYQLASLMWHSCRPTASTASQPIANTFDCFYFSTIRLVLKFQSPVPPRWT